MAFVQLSLFPLYIDISIQDGTMIFALDLVERLSDVHADVQFPYFMLKQD